MPYQKALMSLIASFFMMAAASSPIHAITPQDAFAKGCAGCHNSESKILRRIPAGPDSVRRSWIERFMANHPNESDTLKSDIVDYLIARSASPKKWWQL